MTDVVKRGGESAILALLWPKTEADMTPVQRAAFYEAAAEQEAYAASRARRVSSEAVGDVKVTYEDGGDGTRVGGEEISPKALSMLLAAGLLTRWI